MFLHKTCKFFSFIPLFIYHKIASIRFSVLLSTIIFFNKLLDSSENSTDMEKSEISNGTMTKVVRNTYLCGFVTRLRMHRTGKHRSKIRRRLNTPGFWHFFFIMHMYNCIFFSKLNFNSFFSFCFRWDFEKNQYGLCKVNFLRNYNWILSHFMIFVPFKFFKSMIVFFGEYYLFLCRKMLKYVFFCSIKRVIFLNKWIWIRNRWLQYDIIFMQISSILHIFNMDYGFPIAYFIYVEYNDNINIWIRLFYIFIFTKNGKNK